MLRLLKVKDGTFEAFNLGSEKGYSVLEIVKATEKNHRTDHRI